jgi:hypothetical protein
VYMHGRGVLHRDLKLTNILISKADGAPILIDFGAASFTHALELTDAGLPPGTERYRSPEANLFTYENRKNPKARYDFKVADELFAFGVMLHDALTDPRPTEERLRTDVNSVLLGLTPPEERNPRIPAALASLVRRLLSPVPAQRPENAEMVRRELEELLEHPGAEYRVPVHRPSSQVVEPAPAGEAAPAVQRPSVSRRRLRRAGTLAGLLAVSALASLAVHSAPPAPAPVAVPSPSAEAPTPSGDSAGTVAHSPDTVLPASTPSSPAQNAVPPHPEGPAMKTARSASPVCATQHVPTFTSKARFRQWCQSAGVVGTALAFCAGCPGAQLRPEPGDCPYLEEMEKNGLREPSGVEFSLEGAVPQERLGGQALAPIRNGEKVTATVIKDRHGDHWSGLKVLPPGTLLYGQAWISKGDHPGYSDVQFRFDRVRTPDDREFHVCMVTVWGYGEDGPEPGVVRAEVPQLVRAVERWP